MRDQRPAGAHAALAIAFTLAIAAVQRRPWGTVAAVQRHIVLAAGGGGRRHAVVEVVFAIQRTVDANLRTGETRIIKRGIRRQVSGAVFTEPQRVAKVERNAIVAAVAGTIRGIDALGADRPREPTVHVVVTKLILLFRPRTVPVIRYPTAQVKAAPAVRQVLVDGKRHPVFLPPYGVVAAVVLLLIDGVQSVVQVVVAFGGVAIRRQHDAGLGFGKHAVKGGAIALAVLVEGIALQPRMGDVE